MFCSSDYDIFTSVLFLFSLHHQFLIILSRGEEGHGLTQAQTALAAGAVLHFSCILGQNRKEHESEQKLVLIDEKHTRWLPYNNEYLEKHYNYNNTRSFHLIFVAHFTNVTFQKCHYTTALVLCVNTSPARDHFDLQCCCGSSADHLDTRGLQSWW